MNKKGYICPYCLRVNLILNEDGEVNVECHNCSQEYGVVNFTEQNIGFSVSCFRDAISIKGEECVIDEEDEF